MNTYLFVFLGILACLTKKVEAVTFTVAKGIEWIKQINTLAPGSSVMVYNNMQINAVPGDTLQFEEGIRKSVRFDNLLGDSLHPIVVCNQGQLVTITQPLTGYFGMSFNHCRYVKITGANNPHLLYGIVITNIPGGSGISMNNFSSNFEVGRIRIDGVGSSGIVAKTDPDCENYEAYKSFIMYDLRLHHNYIKRTGNEGIYIGNTGYREGTGIPLNCHDPEFNTHLLPHKIVGVKVYKNICDSTGWDGIQVSASEKAEIYENYIIYDSYADYPNQLSGIIIGEPTRANVYNNTIKNGNGTGIQCFGVGVNIYNNVIINPANSTLLRSKINQVDKRAKSYMSYGIYINDKVCKDNNVLPLSYLVAHNTIVISKTYLIADKANLYGPCGIDISALKYIRNSYLFNNLIVIGSGKNNKNKQEINGIFNDKENSVKLNMPAFISFNNKSKIGYNYYCNNIKAVGFTSFEMDNYSLKPESPVIDVIVKKAITPFRKLEKDILKVNRPQGIAADFGAYEYVKWKGKKVQKKK
ncbi:MAG: right-handed parallel beta-helix repeat-containing protein [Bacteroidia bacterium]|nr:right-handed parallel beta-helix repeat-containing protein [Bacteroidia bacterium]